MASQKQLFLVALLLAIALGCHGSKIETCNTNKDCPACRMGGALCLDGLCTCLDMKDADVAAKNGCKTDSDCANICGAGCSSYSCVGKRCICAC